MNELGALRAYFDAHMEMHAAIDTDKFGRAYAKANQARDRLLQLAGSGDKPPFMGLEAAQDAGLFDADH